MKTIEEHQLFGLLAPVNNSNVDRDNTKEMLKRQRGSAEGGQESSDWEKEGFDHAATKPVVEDGTLEESLASRLWRLMDCFKETLRISETDCDAMRAAGLTAALEGEVAGLQ